MLLYCEALGEARMADLAWVNTLGWVLELQVEEIVCLSG